MVNAEGLDRLHPMRLVKFLSLALIGLLLALLIRLPGSGGGVSSASAPTTNSPAR